MSEPSDIPSHSDDAVIGRRPFRVSRAQEMWLPVGLTVLSFGIGIMGFFLIPARPGDVWENVVAPSLPFLIGIPFLSYALFYRLQWSPAEFFTRLGPWKRRGVHLDRLVSLDVGRAGTAVWIEVVDAHGCRMRLNQTAGWTDQAEWGPLLAQAAHTCGAQMSKTTENHLVKTPSQRRWGTPGDDSEGRHRP